MSSNLDAQLAQQLDCLDGGHSLPRHGPEVSDADLQNRLTTGIAPDGVFSPALASTRFKTYRDWIQTRQVAFDEIAKREGLDLNQPPPSGKLGPFYIIIDHGYPIDDGFISAGNPVTITNPITGRITTVYTGTLPITGLTRTHTQIQWNKLTHRWQVRQHYPDAKGWNPNTSSYSTPLP